MLSEEIMIYASVFFLQFKVISLKQVRDKFGRQVEAFFIMLTAIQFHFLFYCTRPLPNILALGVGNYVLQFNFIVLAFAFIVDIIGFIG